MILELLQAITSEPVVSLGIQELFTILGAAVVGGKLWFNTIANEKRIAEAKNNVTELDKKCESRFDVIRTEFHKAFEESRESHRVMVHDFECRVEKAEQGTSQVVEKVVGKLDALADSLTQLSGELKKTLADHHTRLTLLERSYRVSTPEEGRFYEGED